MTASFGAGSAHAGKITYGANCAPLARQYTYRGDETADFPGARLWNLEGLRHRWGGQNTDPCVEAVFKQAVNDQKEYWEFIGSKYGCDKTPPASVSQCDSFRTNTQWLGFFKKVLELPAGPTTGANTPAPIAVEPGAAPVIAPTGNCDRTSAPGTAVLTGGAEQNIRGVAAVLPPPAEGPSGPLPATALPGANPAATFAQVCASVPAGDRYMMRASFDMDPSEAESFGTQAWNDSTNCIRGAVVSVIQEAIDLLKSAVTTLRMAAPWNIPSTLSGMADFVREYWNDPKGVTTHLMTMIYDYMFEDLTDFRCYKPQYQFRKACAFAGKAVAVLAEMYFGPAKVGQAAKWIAGKTGTKMTGLFRGNRAEFRDLLNGVKKEAAAAAGLTVAGAAAAGEASGDAAAKASAQAALDDLSQATARTTANGAADGATAGIAEPGAGAAPVAAAAVKPVKPFSWVPAVDDFGNPLPTAEPVAQNRAQGGYKGRGETPTGQRPRPEIQVPANPSTAVSAAEVRPGGGTATANAPVAPAAAPAAPVTAAAPVVPAAPAVPAAPVTPEITVRLNPGERAVAKLETAPVENATVEPRQAVRPATPEAAPHEPAVKNEPAKRNAGEHVTTPTEEEYVKDIESAKNTKGCAAFEALIRTFIPKYSNRPKGFGGDNQPAAASFYHIAHARAKELGFEGNRLSPNYIRCHRDLKKFEKQHGPRPFDFRPMALPWN